MQNKHKHTSQKKKLQEYSKRVLAALIIIWFAVAIFGVIVIAYQLLCMPEYGVNLDGLFTYVGYPMTGGIVTYLIKSAVENRQKIKNNSQVEKFSQPDITSNDEGDMINHG